MKERKNSRNNDEWTQIIVAHTPWYKLNFREIYGYRDLLFLLVRRDFVAEFKQTILGPLWYLVQPVFTAYTYYLVLHKMGKMETDGIPPFLFYIAGLTIWSYFSDCLTKTSGTFVSNSNVFGKVYFPRMIVPLSIFISSLIKFSIQFVLFLFVLFYSSMVDNGYCFSFRWEVLLFPVPILLIGLLSLSIGLTISSLTTKYRDLKFALTFGIQLLMYGSAVIVSFNSIPEQYRNLLRWNPVANIVEFFKRVMLGHAPIDWQGVLYSIFCIIVLFAAGVLLFNRTEKTFMDTV